MSLDCTRTMKNLFYILFFVLLSLTLLPQERMNLTEQFSAAEKERVVYWKPDLYKKAIASMRRAYSLYLAADSEEKRINSNRFEELNYNIARAYSLLNQADSAAIYLQKYYDLAYATYSTYYREIDYYHLNGDPDLDNIRSNKKFQDILMRFKEVG